MNSTLSLLIESVFTLNLLIACTYLMTSLGLWLGKKFQIESTYKSHLKTNYFLLIAALLVPLGITALPEADLFDVSHKVWATPQSITHAVTKTAEQLIKKNDSSFGWFGTISSMQVALAAFLLLGCAYYLFRLIKDWTALPRFIKACDQWRQIGSTIVLLSNQKISPFSFRFGRKKYVVLPHAMLANKSHTALALAHEFQHHRQGDTSWSYVFGFLKAFCFWNPTFLLLKKRTEEFQEFACDEALLGRQQFSAKAYGQCLLWTAAFSRQTRQLVLGTTGLAGRYATKRSHILTRRVQFMMSKNHTNERKKHSWWLKILGGMTLTVMSGLGIAANGTIGDVTLTMDDAQELVIGSSQDFPITMNEDVLRQLNRYVGTARGRKFVRESLKRMGEHRNVVQSAISDYQLPLELMAVPVIESGYRNLEPTAGKPHYGAGVWMFIKSTAQHYGLRVDDQVDERLNVELETDAAMRYLKSAHLQFRDWELALLAYNAGFSAVEKGIQQTGSRNAWELIRNGHDNDQNYLAKVIAVVLIMKNPHLLN
jgi:membrane-bound lytic murein transglycosylase D